MAIPKCSIPATIHKNTYKNVKGSKSRSFRNELNETLKMNSGDKLHIVKYPKATDCAYLLELMSDHVVLFSHVIYLSPTDETNNFYSDLQFISDIDDFEMYINESFTERWYIGVESGNEFELNRLPFTITIKEDSFIFEEKYLKFSVDKNKFLKVLSLYYFLQSLQLRR